MCTFAGMNREILRIALPAIVANITVPLLGLVDTAIAGHLGDKVFIGAVAVGAMMFNLVYWNFGFLRMSTSGMTAQTCGSGDFHESAKLLGEKWLNNQYFRIGASSLANALFQSFTGTEEKPF